MTTLEIPVGSHEFIEVELNSDDDLTTSSVEIGLSLVDGGVPGTWLTATWPTPGVNLAQTATPVDTTGMQLAYWVVWARITDAPEVVPRPYGYIRIVSDTGSSVADIALLRQMIDEPTAENFGDAMLSDMLAAAGGNLKKAAGGVWALKAAELAKLTNVTESGSTRNLGDLAKQAIAMARFYDPSQGVQDPVTTTGTTRIRQIQRPTAPNP